MARHSLADISDLLGGVPLFANLTKRQLRALAGKCSEVHFEPGEVIVKELDSGQHMVAVTAGRADVVRGGRTLATLTAGDVIGEMSLIDGEPRSATVVADGEVHGLIVYGTAFRKLLNDHPTMVSKLLLAQTARIRELDKRASLTA